MEFNNVLVVEDESSIRKFITINLNRSDFKVCEASSGEEALEKLNNFKPDVVILDVMLPGIDGFEVCQKIKLLLPQSIVIMLTAKSQDMDKIMGLELGADDYMAKPFNPLELIARIRAIQRRLIPSISSSQIETIAGNIVIDEKAQKVYKDNRELDLTPREFSILRLFIHNPGKAMNRDELLDHIWGKNYFGDIKTVDVHIRRLREKVEEDASNPQIIETVWGYGCRFKA